MTNVRKNIQLLALASVFCACGTTSRKAYQVTEIVGTRTEINAHYDKQKNGEMKGLVEKYGQKMRQVMHKQIAVSEQTMQIGRPESLLTNFTSDQMYRFANEKLNEKTHLALMNVNGHRASLPQGNVTVGDMFEVYSFDNKLVLVKLKGSDLTKIFESYIRMGGGGVSANVRVVGIGDRLISVLIDGKPIDNESIYNIVTLDYLADGNDGMEALRKAISVKKTGIVLREMMIEYAKQQSAKGERIGSQLDGRIIISK